MVNRKLRAFRRQHGRRHAAFSITSGSLSHSHAANFFLIERVPEGEFAPLLFPLTDRALG